MTAKHPLKLFPKRSGVRLDEFAHGTIVKCALRTYHPKNASSNTRPSLYNTMPLFDINVIVYKGERDSSR